MGRREGKIASDWQISCREGSSFSRKVNNAINEGKLACFHRNCIENNVFYKANGILHHYTHGSKLITH